MKIGWMGEKSEMVTMEREIKRKQDVRGRRKYKLEKLQHEDIISRGFNPESKEVKAEVQKPQNILVSSPCRRRSTMVVTSGALTIILLAATLVTGTFLMSPLIEQVFGKHTHCKHHSVQRTNTNHNNREQSIM